MWFTAFKRLRKEMFDLMTHSTHFIYSYWKEENVLFNDTLNTFTVIGRKEGNVLFDDTLNTFFDSYWKEGKIYI